MRILNRFDHSYDRKRIKEILQRISKPGTARYLSTSAREAFMEIYQEDNERLACEYGMSPFTQNNHSSPNTAPLDPKRELELSAEIIPELSQTKS